jgi:hypothetical protein
MNMLLSLRSHILDKRVWYKVEFPFEQGLAGFFSRIVPQFSDCSVGCSKTPDNWNMAHPGNFIDAILQGIPVPGEDAIDARYREQHHQLLRHRLRQEGLNFCDDPIQETREGLDKTKDEKKLAGWFNKRRATDDQLQPEQENRNIPLGAELPILALGASSTDHEAQV